MWLQIPQKKKLSHYFCLISVQYNCNSHFTRNSIQTGSLFWNTARWKIPGFRHKIHVSVHLLNKSNPYLNFNSDIPCVKRNILKLKSRVCVCMCVCVRARAPWKHEWIEGKLHSFLCLLALTVQRIQNFTFWPLLKGAGAPLEFLTEYVPN